MSNPSSVSVDDAQSEEAPLVLSLEDLPDEVLLSVISRLSPWEAMALEVTSKRMHVLVRSHQIVQKHVDINYPSDGMQDEKREKFITAIEKMILSRFGPKLLKISDSKEMSLFRNSSFVEKLAVKCPNLVELPTDELIMLQAYSHGRACGLKKMTVNMISHRHRVSAEQAKEQFVAAPQLEVLKLLVEHFTTLDENVLFFSHIEEAQMSSNCIRSLEICCRHESRVGIYPAIQRLVLKLPKLESFSLQMKMYKEDHVEALTRLFQSIRCTTKKILFTFELSPLDKSPLEYYATFPDSRLCYEMESEEILAIKDMKNVRKLTFESCSWDCGVKEPPPLVFSSSVRELNILVDKGHVHYFACCIRAHGAQLQKMTYVSNSMSIDEANELLGSIRECCSELESLEVRTDEQVLEFGEENLKAFLEGCGKKLRCLNLRSSHTSFPQLELICQECKSLEHLSLILEVEPPQKRRLKELIVGMVNLREARIDFAETSAECVKYCRYANRKLLIN